MRKSPATTILLVLLVVSALSSVALCGLYIGSSRTLRDLQRSATLAQNNRNLVLMLGSDVLEYSKKNPSIDPILEAAGFKSRPVAGTAPATNKPGVK